MKKMFTARLLALVMMVSMMLSMALPATALTTYDLELRITEALSSVKHTTGRPSKITVNDESADVSLNADLTTELVTLLSANFEGSAKDNRTGLWDFESDTMGLTIEAGLNAYRVDDNGASWNAWIDAFAADNTITGTGSDKGNLVSLLKQGKKVNDMTPNKEYVLVYKPEATAQLAPGIVANIASDDPATGNTYTFTLKLVKTVTGTGGGISGGGGGGASQQQSYTITVNDCPNASVTANAAQAQAGTKITVTVKVDSGYMVDTVAVRQQGSAGLLSVTDNGGGLYTFTMPSAAVSVTVTTKEIIDPYNPSAPGHTSNCPASKYNDVDLAAWYHEAVDYVVYNGLMAGFDADSFGPDWELSRAMVAQIFFNLEGQPAGEYDNPFPDVTEGKWYYNAITWAFAHGVVSGYGDGLYRPEQDVTREELVQIYCNYAKEKGWSDGVRIADLTGFVDYEDIAPWHEVAVSWGVGSKLLGGKGGNVMAPKMSATRAEAAQMLMNLCENIRK